MPHKYFADQYDDEEVLMVFNQHPVVMRKGLIIASLGLLLGPLYVLAVSYISPNNTPDTTQYFLLLLAGFILATLLFFPYWMRWRFSVYIVTDRRFIDQTYKGFFKKKVVDIDLRQIQMINYEVNGLQETLLGFGTMVVHTLMGDLVIKDLHHPAKVQKEMLKILRDRGIVPVTPNATDGRMALDEAED